MQHTPPPAAPRLLPALAGCLLVLTACSGGEPVADSQASAQPAASAQQDGGQNAATGAQSQAERARQAPDAAGHGVDDGHDHGLPAAASASLADLPPNARLEVDKSDHDFGTAVEGEVLTHTWELKSTGEGPLVITTAKPTCGCTVSKLEVRGDAEDWRLYEFGSEVAPGADLRLTAELDTKNKKSMASSKINIFCNDPRGTVTLGLSAKLDTYFNVAPNAISFGELSVADSAERSFDVTGREPGPFLLRLEDRPQPEGMKIDLQPVSPDAEGRASRWKVVVTLGPDAREGNLGFPVSLMSDRAIEGAKPSVDGTTPHYGVTVMTTARVRGLITWEPQYLSFGLVRPGQVVSRTFTVRSFDPEFSFGADLGSRFAGPNDTLPDFKWAERFSVVQRPAADGKGIDVEVTLNGLPDDADGSFQGRLFLATGHPSKPEVPVLFSGVCRPGVSRSIPGVEVKKTGGEDSQGGR